MVLVLIIGALYLFSLPCLTAAQITTLTGCTCQADTAACSSTTGRRGTRAKERLLPHQQFDRSGARRRDVKWHLERARRAPWTQTKRKPRARRGAFLRLTAGENRGRGHTAPHERRSAHQPPGRGDQPLPPPARPQPRGLVPLGSGGARAGAARGQADLPLGGLLGLSLVPRDGARELRERGHRRAPQPRLRQHQGRPRGAAGPRRDLHEGRAGHDRSGRLADERVPHARPAALLRRHLLPARPALRAAGLRRAARDPLQGLERGPAEAPEAGPGPGRAHRPRGHRLAAGRAAGRPPRSLARVTHPPLRQHLGRLWRGAQVPPRHGPAPVPAPRHAPGCAPAEYNAVARSPTQHGAHPAD